MQEDQVGIHMVEHDWPHVIISRDMEGFDRMGGSRLALEDQPIATWSALGTMGGI